MKNFKLFCLITFLALTAGLLHSEDVSTSENLEEVLLQDDQLHLDQLSAGNSSSKRTRRLKQKTKKAKKGEKGFWGIYGSKNAYLYHPYHYFFKANVGIGFLYFSNTKAALVQERGFNVASNNSLQGKLGYNRTPVFDFQLGAKLFSWMDLALSYLHQGGVSIQSKAQFYNVRGSGVAPNLISFVLESNLALDAILACFNFNLPYSLVWTNIGYSPYLSVGVGPGWQSWTHNTVVLQQRIPLNNITTEALQDFYKSKISANAVWFVDLGVKLCSIQPLLDMSLNIGTKFIGWGQARQIGLQSQQGGATTHGMQDPFRIKFVYSFAPYLGLKWNY